MSEKVLHNPTMVINFKVLLLLLITSVLLSACYPVTRSKGVVKDEQGLPIVNAVVKISGKSVKPEALRTKQDGAFDFGNLNIISHQDPIEIKLTIEKEGFDIFSKRLNFNAENEDEVILQRSI